MADLSQVSTDDLLQMLQSHPDVNKGKPSQPQANAFVDAARSIPGGVAKGVAAVIGLPGDVSDLANRGMDYLTGTHDAQRYPALVTSANINRALSALFGGYYQPKTKAGSYAETIASFVPAAIAPGGVATRLARVVAPAVASETAGELTQGTPAEPYARTGAALIAGGAPAAVRLLGRAANAVSVATTGKSFLDPAVEAQAQVAKAVAKDAPTSIAQNSARYTAAGASTPSLVDVGGNNVRRLIRAAAAGDGPGQNLALDYGDTIRGNYQDRLLAHTKGLTADTRTPEQLANDLAEEQQNQAQTKYAAPYAASVRLTPDAVAALSGQHGRLAIDRAISAAAARQNPQQVDELVGLKSPDLNWSPTAGWVTSQGKFAPVPQVSGAALDRVRIALGERGEAAARNGAKDIAGGLFQRRAAIGTALDNAPGLQEARQSYRQMQAQRDAVDVGAAAYNTPSQDYTARLRALTQVAPEAQGTAAVGHRQALANAIERGAEGATGAANRIYGSTQQTENLATTFGPGKAQKYQDAVRLETQRLRNANFISPNTGSQTALRASDAQILNSIPLSRRQLVGMVFDKLRAGLTMTPQERAEIVKLGISPFQAAGIAKRAPSNVIAALKAGAVNATLSQAANP